MDADDKQGIQGDIAESTDPRMTSPDDTGVHGFVLSAIGIKPTEPHPTADDTGINAGTSSGSPLSLPLVMTTESSPRLTLYGVRLSTEDLVCVEVDENPGAKPRHRCYYRRYH